MIDSTVCVVCGKDWCAEIADLRQQLAKSIDREIELEKELAGAWRCVENKQGTIEYLLKKLAASEARNARMKEMLLDVLSDCRLPNGMKSEILRILAGDK